MKYKLPHSVKYKPPRLAAIFFGLFLQTGGGGDGPLAPPGSATASWYRSDMVNSKSFKVKVLLRIKWKFELHHEAIVVSFDSLMRS